MAENIIGEVRKFVEAESRKPKANYGYEIYCNHLVSMHRHAVELAKKLGADLEIVELAAWLHDIGSIIYGRQNHHITGAEIAEMKLKELNYPADRIEKVKNCILYHRGSLNGKGKTPEERVIIEADAVSCFDFVEGQFHAAFVGEGKTQKEGKVSVLRKLENKYNQLILPESREIVKPKYEAAMLLFS